MGAATSGGAASSDNHAISANSTSPARTANSASPARTTSPARTAGPANSASEEANLRLLRARNHMDRRYADPLDVSQLAALSFTTRAHFIREFKRVFGETPYRYLQRRRVERAMFLLRHRDDSVTDVCMAVGFSSLGTFSRTFSEIVGRSPSAYRESVAHEHLAAPTSFAMRWARPTDDRRPTDGRRPTDDRR